MNIPLTPKVKVAKKRQRKYLIQNAIHVLFWLSFAVSVIAFIVQPSWVFGIPLVFCVISFLAQRLYLRRIPWGLVHGTEGVVKPFTVVQAEERSGSGTVARTVADETGRYVLVLDPGSYRMQATALDGKHWQGKEEIRKQRKVIQKKIVVS